MRVRIPNWFRESVTMSAARRIKMPGKGNVGYQVSVTWCGLGLRYQGKEESCKTGLELGTEWETWHICKM